MLIGNESMSLIMQALDKSLCPLRMQVGKGCRGLVGFFVVMMGMLVLLSQPCAAEQFGLYQAGLRGGFSDSRQKENFTQFEAFMNWRTPWSWALHGPTRLAILLDANAGGLDGGNKTAGVGSVGPSLLLNWVEGKISFSGGTGVTVLGDDRFGGTDFGGPIQFTSHAGLAAVPIARLVLGYRIQHMSNAGIYNSNPGLNLHMFELAYRF